MMSQVEKRAQNVCTPALAAMKQRQEVLEWRLAQKSLLTDMTNSTGNDQINILRDKQDLLEKKLESKLASLDVDSDNDDEELTALVKKMDMIAQKNKELENWRVSFDKTQQERFDQHAENVAKQLYEHSKEINNNIESHSIGEGI
eukprot:14294936-Ditylum_brightwellii.AAC.1